MNSKTKFELQEKFIQRILFFFIFLNFFFPKISLLNLPGISQGLRLENIICFFLLITLIVSKRFSLTSNDYDYLKPYIIFFIIFIFSTYIGWLNSVKIHLIFILRVIEYLVFAFLIFKSQIKLKDIEIFVKFFYLACLIGIILQHYGLIGTFSSTGLAPKTAGKYTAFVSGSWELAFMISISYFIIIANTEINKKQIIFYFILTVLILYFSGNRTIIIAFLISFIIYFIFKFKTINPKIIVYFFLAIFPIVSLFILNEYELQSLDQYSYKINTNPHALLENIYNIEFNFVYQSIKEFLLYGNTLDVRYTSQQYTSLVYRILHWDLARDNFLINGFTVIFGSGAEHIYYDSLIFRILFTTGLIGSLYFIILMIKTPIYIVIFFLLSGLTIDFIASYKLTVTVILLHFVIIKRNNHANRY